MNRKRLHLALLPAAVAGLALFSQPSRGLDGSPSITEPLRSALERARTDEWVPVSVVLREQVSLREIGSLASGPRGPARRRAISGRLKEAAGRSQAGLLAFLRSEQTRGTVGPRLRPLWIGNIVGVDATRSVIEEIAKRGEVDHINYNPKVDVFLEGPSECRAPAPPEAGAAGRTGRGGSLASAGAVTGIECGVAKTRAPEVWNEGNTGQGAIVAMIDTGVCYTHPDIKNQIWVNPGEDLDHDGVVMDADDRDGTDNDGNGFVDDFIGWDFDVNDNDPNDDSNGHGSHTAGTVAGDGTQGTKSGMAPDAKLMVLRVGVTFADEVDVWSAMQYAADNGADTISMSLGWPHNQNPDRATWRQNCENTINMGTAMVIAAGNEGSGNEPDNVRTPGDVPRVITVGATDCSDLIADFSSRGPVSWQNVPPYNDYPYPPGLIKPDVSAPGVNTTSHNFCSGYTVLSGTSMATPHTAGAAALMISSDPSIENDEIKQTLEDTAVDLGSAGKDNSYGSGRVDAFEAVDQARPKVRYQSHRTEDLDPNYGNGDGGLDTGETLSLIVTVKNETDHPVSDVRAFVTTPTPGIRIRSGFARFPDLAAGQQAESLAPQLTFTVDSGCFYDAQFDIEVRWDEPLVSRKSFSMRVGTSVPATLFDDSFESNSGLWTAGAAGATDGYFVREDPVGTKDSQNHLANPEDDHTPAPGVRCWVSGNGGPPVSSDDIDGGSVILTSSVLDAHDYETMDFSYWRWFYTQPLFQPGGIEFLNAEVSNDGGASWTVLENLKLHVPTWTQQTFTLQGRLAFTAGFRFRFVATDGTSNGDQTVEAAVDDVKANGTRVVCEPFSEPAHRTPNNLGNSLRLARQSAQEVRYSWSEPPVDAQHDAATFYRVWSSSGPAGGFTEAASPTAAQWVESSGMTALSSRFYVLSAANSGGDSPEIPSP